MQKRYQVKLTEAGCSMCGCGKAWDIIDPDGALCSTRYADGKAIGYFSKEQAGEMCAMLNEALDRGAKRGEFDCR